MTNRKERIWVDGCFDFFHHGHAGALMQARQFGDELYVGLHTDEEIGKNKGPVVMHLDERCKAVDACKWATKYIDDAPYVTDPAFMDSYQCQYVVHGDDITTDANGYDCYQEVKDLGRFLVVKRTPNISTTDLIGRMLSSSRSHHIPPLTAANSNHFLLKKAQIDRFKMYATDETAKNPYDGVYALEDGLNFKTLVEPSDKVKNGLKNSYYVCGGFDLFHPGHMEFLEQVHQRAKEVGALVVVGLYDDETFNQAMGENYPVMNLFERTLCVLQCKYVDTVVLGAPFTPKRPFFDILQKHGIHATKVLHGFTGVVSNKGHKVDKVDPYEWIKKEGQYLEIPPSTYRQMDASEIVNRVLTHRRVYEERQRKKGVKAEHEEEMKGAS